MLLMIVLQIIFYVDVARLPKSMVMVQGECGPRWPDELTNPGCVSGGVLHAITAS
jgi:hypothetical protein